jgi:hypothetical protein
MGGRLDAKERRLRAELAWVRARYDYGQMSDATFAAVKQIEVEIGWLQHAKGIVQRRATIIANRRHEVKA